MDARQGAEMARRLGWLMAAELRAFAIDFSFAPCVDLDYGVSEIIGDRAFHRRPEVVAELALACMQGMREAGMAATAKHFPGHGAVVADSHLALPVDRRSLEDLAPDILPYRRLIANDLPAVMMAHVLFPEVDSVPASFSQRWVQQILRGELNFRGVVFADDLSMEGATGMGDIVDRAGAAMAAGCDILPVCNSRPSVVRLLEGLREKPGPASQLRLLRMRGRDGPGREELLASAHYRSCLEWLDRCARPPELILGQA
jgi:beta-N-acetylhexosaminidase